MRKKKRKRNEDEESEEHVTKKPRKQKQNLPTTKKSDVAARQMKRPRQRVPIREIKKGITEAALELFYLQDLRKYCSENDLKSIGKKQDVIKRILTHLEEEVVHVNIKKRSEDDFKKE